jgi:hypothetical protein
MLLSKLPLVDVDQFVLHSTVFRRTAVYARMKYDGELSVDVYCAHAPPLLGSNMPYTGNYSNGANVANGAAWQEEQVFAIGKLVEWIKKKSGDRPAIIIGDWSSSAKVLDGSGMVVTGPDGLPAVADVTPDTIGTLVSAGFIPAVPTGFKPQCTRCPALGTGELHNPYNVGFNDPMWTLRVFIKDGWAPNLTTSAGLFYNEPDRVTFPMPNEFGLAGPLSDTFGFTVNIRRP